MKKIIGILGVAVIAATIFFSANNVTGSSSDITLVSLVHMNVANAQTEGDNDAKCLITEVMERKKQELTGKGCYRDVTGPDLLEGYVKTCQSVNNPSSQCQPLRCDTEAIKCYSN